MTATMDRLGHLRCIDCCDATCSLPGGHLDPTPDGYPVAITDPSSQLEPGDSCDSCAKTLRPIDGWTVTYHKADR